MFLFMIPVDPGGAPIDTTIAPIVVPVTTPAFHDGQPIQVSNGVTLTMTDGFTVTMSQEDTNVVLNSPEETQAEYELRLCKEYAEAKPWLDTTC